MLCKAINMPDISSDLQSYIQDVLIKLKTFMVFPKAFIDSYDYLTSIKFSYRLKVTKKLEYFYSNPQITIEFPVQ